MILRSIFLLGVGVAVACATPVFAAGTTAKTETTATTADSQKVAALNPEVPKADTAVVKKPKAKPTAKKASKKKVAKAKKPAEEAVPEKPKSLFAALFGGGIKDKGKDDPKVKAKDDPKAKAKSAKAAAAAKAAADARLKAKREPKPEPEEILPAITANSGELRSEKPEKKDFFAALFGGSKQRMLPETRALDSVLEKSQAKKKFKVKADFVPQEVEFSGYTPGTIVIDTNAKFLYLVEGRSTARRYAIAVGRDGLQFKGEVKVGDKQEWPRWIPTKEMQQREPKKYGQYKEGMDGGPENPLGARAIYLYLGKQDTHLRIHGTNQPQSIGSASSNGCFRMINDHVIDLYGRVKVGTPVVVL